MTMFGGIARRYGTKVLRPEATRLWHKRSEAPFITEDRRARGGTRQLSEVTAGSGRIADCHF
jgi:hypothetical protein